MRIAYNTIDITGKRFERLIAISYCGKSKWRCKCDCGKYTIVDLQNLKKSRTRSCGCLNFEVLSKRALHGNCKHPLWGIYRQIKNRCYNKKNKSYHNYGLRGIRMSKSWYNSFHTFVKDMGMKLSETHSIERRDNDKGYNKFNCYWATTKEQGNNKRTCIYLTYKNKTLNITQWADILNVKRSLLYSRYHRHLDTKQILIGSP